MSVLPLPNPSDSQLVVPAPGDGPGNWSGAASALVDGDQVLLTWRERRPLTEGRGVGVVVAASSDGVHFDPVCRVSRETFGAESFEKPCLVRLEDGRWRLYLSCATPGSKHWWVESLTADTLAGLPEGERHVVFPGDDSWGVKDPVVYRRDDGWHAWLCCHPLDVVDAEDRMTTRYLTSDDGLVWRDHGPVLEPGSGGWDDRGARVTTVASWEPLVVLYDGRPDAASNWYETTSAARAVDGRLERMPEVRVRSPHSDGACRYASVVELPEGGHRVYAEVARPDGAHDLVTTLVPPAHGA